MKKSLLLGAALSLVLATSAFAADPVKIVFVGKNTGNPYFDGIIQGFKDACGKINCSFEFVAPARPQIRRRSTSSRPRPTAPMRSMACSTRPARPASW